MIIITGPQDTSEALTLLADVAAILDAIPAYGAALQWVTATALYCLAGWERCPLAVADVAIAECAGLDVHLLTA